MEIKLKVRTTWSTMSSDYELIQKIIVNGDSILELIYELEKEMFNKYPYESEKYREYFIEDFSNPEYMKELYTEIVFFLGQIDYFDLYISHELREYLSEEQLLSQLNNNDYFDGESIFLKRMENGKNDNWSKPWRTIEIN